MIDIKFYQTINIAKQLFSSGQLTPKEMFQQLVDCRTKIPVVFNIETTNNCNMKCHMCPRTTEMTRPIGEMSLLLFKKIVKQIKPWTSKEWRQWETFVKMYYKIMPNEMNENHFFLYIVPKVVTLHGFGEPLLDRYIVNRIKILKENKIPSYFSCNPFNITLKTGRGLLWAGLNYFKFSGDNIKLFEKSKQIIEDLIITRDLNKDDTTFILDIVGNEKDYKQLQKMFKDYDVYMYLKSKDNQWYNKAGTRQQAIHWNEICQFPWSSMSIMWDGSVVPCAQDFNCEMVLGNIKKESLRDIWNSKAYNQFRKNHLTGDAKVRCFSRCDMRVVGKI